jgi:hypothetical protein
MFTAMDDEFRVFWGFVLKILGRITHQSNFYLARVALLLNIIPILATFGYSGHDGYDVFFTLTGLIWLAMMWQICRLSEEHSEKPQDVASIGSVFIDIVFLRILRVVWMMTGTVLLVVDVVLMNFTKTSIGEIRSILLAAAAYFMTDYLPKKPSRIKAALKRLATKLASLPRPQLAPSPRPNLGGA